MRRLSYLDSLFQTGYDCTRDWVRLQRCDTRFTATSMSAHVRNRSADCCQRLDIASHPDPARREREQTVKVLLLGNAQMSLRNMENKGGVSVSCLAGHCQRNGDWGRILA